MNLTYALELLLLLLNYEMNKCPERNPYVFAHHEVHRSVTKSLEQTACLKFLVLTAASAGNTVAALPPCLPSSFHATYWQHLKEAFYPCSF